MITWENFIQTAKDFGAVCARTYFKEPITARGSADFDRPQDAQAFAEICRESHRVLKAKPVKCKTVVSFWSFAIKRGEQ